jgi:ATP-binding cassette subfamily B protein
MTMPKTLVPFLWHFIKRQPWVFLITFITALVWSINEVLFPYFVKWLVNAIHDFKGNPHDIYQVVWLPLVSLMSCWVVMEISMRTQGLVLVGGFPHFRANIRMAVFDYTKQHSHEYFANNFAGSISQKLSSLPNSCQLVLEIVLFNFCSISMGFLLAVIFMWQAQSVFALVLLGWFVLHMGITVLFLKTGNQRWELHSDAVTTLSGKVVDCITNITSVRLFARNRYESDYLKAAQADELHKAKRALWNIEIMRTLQGICGLVFIAIMMTTLVRGWMSGWVTLGDFSLISMLSFWILGMIWYLSYQIGVLVREASTINQSLTLITAKHEIVDQPNANILQVTRGEIRFDDVTFGYRKDPNLFEKLNITIAAGQKIGLVGFSGSGKSTFVNLILRLFDLRSGRILIDNQDIAQVTQDSLHEKIAMIPQDPALFHRTLMENIRYGRLDASDEEVIAASKLAHCHEFIEKLTENYQSLVGERGIKLSGGQRQRISIARAILKNAPILILDEATSSLDSVTEKLIQESLAHLMQNRTTLVIAHRLSTLANMDTILVFDKGKIVEYGTQEELLQQEGHFARLWQMQTHGMLVDEEDDEEYGTAD